MPTKGRVQVAPGQVIQSAEWGNPLWDQSVQCFASAADRANQYPSPHAGAVTYLADVQRLEFYTSGAWVDISTTRVHTATVSQVTVPSGGALGYTTAITIPAAPYPRVASVSSCCHIAGVTGGANTISTASIRKDGNDIVLGRCRDSSYSIMLAWADTIGANVAAQYQGVLGCIGTGSTTSEVDPRFTYLRIAVTPGIPAP